MRHYLLRKNTDPSAGVVFSESLPGGGGGRRREVIRMFKHILVWKGWWRWRWADKIIKYFPKIFEGI